MKANDESTQDYLYPFLESFGDLTTDETTSDADFSNFEQFYCHIFTTESNRLELVTQMQQQQQQAPNSLLDEESMEVLKMNINDVRVLNFKNLLNGGKPTKPSAKIVLKTVI